MSTTTTCRQGMRHLIVSTSIMNQGRFPPFGSLFSIVDRTVAVGVHCGLANRGAQIYDSCRCPTITAASSSYSLSMVQFVLSSRYLGNCEQYAQNCPTLDRIEQQGEAPRCCGIVIQTILLGGYAQQPWHLQQLKLNVSTPLESTTSSRKSSFVVFVPVI